MAEFDHAFQKLCHEAVLACGADVGAIERYVLAKVETLSPTEREGVRRDVARVIGCQVPDRGAHGSH